MIEREPDDARRRRELAAIHLGAKRLGLDRDTYEDFLFRVARVRSAAKLDIDGRRKVIEEMRTLGFRRAARRDPVKEALAALGPVPGDHGLEGSVDRQKAFARALWAALGELGALRDQSERGLDKFVHHQTGMDALRFLTPDKTNKVIEALKDWLRREARKKDGAS